jgi:hypothetical protein
MKYSLRTNRKKISAGSTSDRDRQFLYLCRQRDQFEKRGDPVLSVDAKKRELIGNFKNPGVKWVKWTPLSRPFFARNKLRSDGVSVEFGAALHRSRPWPFRPSWGRRRVVSFSETSFFPYCPFLILGPLFSLRRGSRGPNPMPVPS